MWILGSNCAILDSINRTSGRIVTKTRDRHAKAWRTPNNTCVIGRCSSENCYYPDKGSLMNNYILIFWQQWDERAETSCEFVRLWWYLSLNLYDCHITFPWICTTATLPFPEVCCLLLVLHSRSMSYSSHWEIFRTRLSNLKITSVICQYWGNHRFLPPENNSILRNQWGTMT
jgi:hypothetical protein